MVVAACVPPMDMAMGTTVMRIGSLFSGAGGLDMAVEQVFGGETVWHCENDPDASKVLAHRWPGVPNLHDITAVDWATVEPVDIVCGGWPCQPFSLAGKRKGAEDERALWPYVAGAVRALRPRIVCLENVSAVLGPEFSRVANDLAEIGYDLAWACLRASDVGAPHRRERLFVVAYASGYRQDGHPQFDGGTITGREEVRRGRHDNGCADEARAHGLRESVADSSCDGRHERRAQPAGFERGSDAALSGAGPLLPTPAVNDIGEGKTVEWWDVWTAKSKAKHGNGNGHGNSLAIEAQRLSGAGPVELLPTPRATPSLVAVDHYLPTPSVSDGTGGHLSRSGDRKDELLLPGIVRTLLPTPAASDATGGGCHPDARVGHTSQIIDTALLHGSPQWGKYEPAIRRWEQLTRPAPSPTEPNKNGNPRLAAAFSEWMLGWPQGWVTQVSGVNRNAQLRIIGNGVCPQQCAAALSWLLSVSERAA